MATKKEAQKTPEKSPAKSPLQKKNISESQNDVTSTSPAQHKDTHSYRGWLNSDSFLKRAFAIYGYSVIPSFVISIMLFAIILLAGLLGSLLGYAG